MAYLFLVFHFLLCPAPAAAASTDTVTITSTAPVTIWGNKAVLRNPQTGNMVDIVREKPAATLPAVKKPARKKKAAKKPAAKKPEAQPDKKSPVERDWALGHLNCMRSPVKLLRQGRKLAAQDQDLTWKPDEPRVSKLFRFGSWQRGGNIIYDMPCGNPSRH